MPSPQEILPDDGMRASPWRSVAAAPSTIFAAQLNERERQIILIVVGIAVNRVAENFGGVRGVAEMRVDVAEQREVGVVLAAFFGDLIRGVERLLVKTFAEIGVGEIEFHVVGIGIGFQRGLKMQDRVVVEAIAREQHADSGLRAVIAGAELVELFHGFARVGDFAEFQICFGEQVEILRLVRDAWRFRR